METSIIAVNLILVQDLLGTLPKNPDVYSEFIKEKTDEPDTVNDTDGNGKGWTCFAEDEKGLFVYDYYIKGFFKHAGNCLKEQLGIKNIKAKLDDFLFVEPRRIYLGKTKPDGVYERPLRAMTMQGPRVTLAKSDLINAGCELDFQIILLKHKEILIETIIELLEYGAYQGLGQFRNGGFGRFKVGGIDIVKR
jgi:hypothetical protein